MNGTTSQKNDSWFSTRSLSEDLNRLFRDELESWLTGTSYPKVNLYKNGEEIFIAAEAPGVDPKDIELSVHDTKVIISGEVRRRSKDEHEVYHRCERSTGKFHRELTLPFRPDTNQIKAECKNGILLVFLPRLEGDKPKKISVNA